MRKLFMLIAALLVVSCGPIYETNYRYTPPQDPLSRPCISQCLADKGQCRNTADLKAENQRLRCELEARDDYERCLSNANGEQGRNSCHRRTCSENASYGQCGSDYHTCFQSCGGIIDEERVCTFNCP